MKRLPKFLKFGLPILLLIPLLSLMGCCLPWPHTTPRSEDVRGRVLDARTHLPIKGAKICFVQSPQHTTYTDVNGYFHIKATRNFHWAYTEGGGWPDNKDNGMGIFHTNYLPLGGVWGGNVGDIFLQPKQ